MELGAFGRRVEAHDIPLEDSGLPKSIVLRSWAVEISKVFVCACVLGAGCCWRDKDKRSLVVRRVAGT